MPDPGGGAGHGQPEPLRAGRRPLCRLFLDRVKAGLSAIVPCKDPLRAEKQRVSLKRKISVVAALLALVGAGTAEALRIRAGDIIVIGNGGFRPIKLPKDRDAPITIYGGGRIETVSGALPPILRKISFEFDRHGSVQTKGLPVCTVRRIEATTVTAARNLCPGAIVGKGFGRGADQLPRTDADPGLLADHRLQRAAQGPQSHRDRPRLHDGPRPDRLRRPGDDRKDQQRRLRLPHQGEDPEDRQRRRDPRRGHAEDRPQVDLQGRAPQLRQRALCDRAPAGPRPIRASTTASC